MNAFTRFLTFAAGSGPIGIALARAGLIVVLLWIGGLKIFKYEADGIVPFVANSPVMSFFYKYPAPDYKAHMNPEGKLVAVIIEPALMEKMKEVPYPRHFLDIETIRSLLPVHRGGKVNGLTLFQFSVHTQSGPGADYVHHAWLNDSRADPNRSFLRALRNTIGDEGAVLIWTRYEEASFNELFTELILSFEMNEDVEWLRKLLSGGRIVDQNAWCFLHYWHPKMAGKTSIKTVLPAVWSEPWPMKTSSLFADFPPDRNPYAVLTEEGGVADGCGAMVAYLDALSSNPVVARKFREELLRYCCVDTLAMVAIWEYWRWRLEQHRAEPAEGEYPP